MVVQKATPKPPTPTYMWSYIIFLILLLTIIGLFVWIYIIYQKPVTPCVANAAICNTYCQSNCKTLCPNVCPPVVTTLLPYNIYASPPPTGILSLDSTFNGVLAQNADGISIGLMPLTTINSPLSQWYFIPTSNPNEIIIQNVGSKNYIHINGLTRLLYVSTIDDASPIQWQITGINNVNYFVFSPGVNTGCVSNTQYITFRSNFIQMSCVEPGVTGASWFTSSATAAKV